jgi:hypothetical protein
MKTLFNLSEVCPEPPMTDRFPIVTVQIAGTIYAQGPTVAPVDNSGGLPVDRQGLLAIQTGETTVAVGRPLVRTHTAVSDARQQFRV